MASTTALDDDNDTAGVVAMTDNNHNNNKRTRLGSRASNLRGRCRAEHDVQAQCG